MKTLGLYTNIHMYINIKRYNKISTYEYYIPNTLAMYVFI